MWPRSSTLHGVHQLISFSQLSLRQLVQYLLHLQALIRVTCIQDYTPHIHGLHLCNQQHTGGNSPQSARVYVHIRPDAYSNNYQQLCWRSACGTFLTVFTLMVLFIS